MARLLLIDDDPVRGALLGVLERQGFEVRAVTAREVDPRLDVDGRELVVVDLRLPDVGGLAAIERIRATSRVPIVVVSSSRQADTATRALEAGADDVLIKPFRLADLRERLLGALRLREGDGDADGLIAGDLHVDFASLCARRSGTDVRLTPTEWRVLHSLARARGRVVSHPALARSVWGDAEPRQSRDALRVHVGSLRAKLSSPLAAGPDLIRTEPGIGYRLAPTTAGGGDTGAPTGDPRLRQELLAAMAAVRVIAGMLDPGLELSQSARDEAGQHLGEAVEALARLVADAADRLP